MRQLFVFLLNVNVNCRKDLFLLEVIVCRVIPGVMGHFSGYDTGNKQTHSLTDTTVI